MASSLALKRFLSSKVLFSSFRPLRVVTQPSRLFNSNAVREYESDDSDDEIDRWSDRRVFSPFSVFVPFSTGSSLSQILSKMDQLRDYPVAAATGVRRNSNVKETADGLHLRLDMPGLGKEDVKVSVEQNTLVIKGESKKEFDEDESGPSYAQRFELPEKLFRTSDIKAEMKNGVLRVFLPKIKEEERIDVFHVNVE